MDSQIQIQPLGGALRGGGLKSDEREMRSKLGSTLFLFSLLPSFSGSRLLLPPFPPLET